ncbi:MAG TPA: response regulator, partial [Acidimicrobiales bacterium]
MATRVMVVEDDADVRAMLLLLLRGEGYDVVEAAIAEEAWEWFSASKVEIDVVILDLKLFGRHGFKL